MSNIVGLTNNDVVVLRQLVAGPKKWGEMRKNYFGEARAKLAASTSFYMKRKNLEEKGLIQKTAVGYEITTLGLESLEAFKGSYKGDIADIKSEAQLKFERENPSAVAKPAAPAEVEA